MNRRIQILALMTLLLLLMGLSACDRVTGTKDNNTAVSLSFVISGSSSSKTASSLKSNHVNLTEAKILVRELEFESDLDDDGVSDDSLDFETDPFVVSLNLDGTPNKIKTANVPEGRYDEVEFEIHKPEDNETPPDPEFKVGTGGNERFSVIVRGNYNGQAFLFRSQVNMEQELEFDTPLTIEGDTDINVTLSVDVSTWFVDSNGNPLDPTLESNRDEINNAIKNSFEAFEDSDEDGLED